MKKMFALALACSMIVPQFSFAAPANTIGRILLEVERNGEAWYVNPVDQRRYYLGRPADAFEVMRSFGLGISNADLYKAQNSRSMRKGLAGRIVLQVEAQGQAFYVSPTDYELHYLGRPDDAFNLMRTLGLGITSADIGTIAVGVMSFDGIDNSVPFVAQAPFGEWNDARQQEGCEETSVLMAMKWVRGEELAQQEAKEAILAMSDWQLEEFGYFEDTSAHDTTVRLFNRWFDYQKVYVENNISSADILEELEAGHLVLVTIDGTKINHSYYVQPGPDRHMIVVHGYDYSTGEFLIHDPGTSKGENHRATMSEMDFMLRDYTSGRYAPLGDFRTAMIVVRR